jgi:hypothetical protein
MKAGMSAPFVSAGSRKSEKWHARWHLPSHERRRSNQPQPPGSERPGRVILAEPVGAVDGEELPEARAGTIDPALDRPYWALADRSRLVVGETRRADEKQGLALIGRQLCKRGMLSWEYRL